jgi:hypothetical protein
MILSYSLDVKQLQLDIPFLSSSRTVTLMQSKDYAI